MFRRTAPIALLAATAAVLVTWLPGPAGEPTPRVLDPDLAAAIETITEESVYNHIYFLASDGLRGRDTPSPGLDAAAAYLVSRHRGYGLEPAGEDGTYYQRFPFRLMGPDPSGARISLEYSGGQVNVMMGENAFLLGGADALDAPLTVVPTDPVAGSTPQDVEGRVAVFPLPGEWGQELWDHSRRQAAWARTEGAVAVIHVLDPAFPGAAIRQLTPALAEPAWQLGDEDPLPQIFLAGDAANRAFSESSSGWQNLRQRARAGDGGGALEGIRFRGALPLDVVVDGRPANVLAMLPGSDPALRDEYIVLSAHFDHVGVGQPMNGDSIYNGADDNSSGTTALLEVARVLGMLPEDQRPGRTVVFAHVSAEEHGLLGSEWWVDNPTLPIENVVANLNADMVGGDPHPDTLVILGKEYSSLGPLIDEVNAGMPELGLTTAPDLWPEERLFFRSDQYNFMRKEIPSLFLFTGLHECYHRPCDTVDFVSYDKLSRITRLLAHTVVELGNREARPEWDPAGLSEVREMVAGGR